MSIQRADIWVRAVSGDLIREAAVIGLRCHAGHVDALLAGEGSLRLAGPGCPADFHQLLLAELASIRLLDGGGRTVIVSAETVGAEGQWAWTTARVPCSASGADSNLADAPVWSIGSNRALEHDDS